MSADFSKTSLLNLERERGHALNKAQYAKTPEERAQGRAVCAAVNDELLRRKNAGPRRRAPEKSLHIEIVKMLRLVLPREAILFHVPNAAHSSNDYKKSAIQGAILKSMGVLSGVPDLFVLYRSKVFAIELKAAKGVASETQRDFNARIVATGFQPVAVIRSLDEMHRQLEAWDIRGP